MREPGVRGMQGWAERGCASHLLAHAGELAAGAGCEAVLEVVEQAEAVVLHREHPLAAGGRRVHRRRGSNAADQRAMVAAAITSLKTCLLCRTLHCDVCAAVGFP